MCLQSGELKRKTRKGSGGKNAFGILVVALDAEIRLALFIATTNVQPALLILNEEIIRTKNNRCCSLLSKIASVVNKKTH